MRFLNAITRVIGSTTAIIFAISISMTVTAKPNVLLIIADDMGLDASACYSQGNQQAPMPNIERMCEQGLVFENAYAAPVCSPTRATMITGQYGFRTGVGTAISHRGGAGLSSDTTSLFDLLATSDYSANIIGKWHLSGPNHGLDHPDTLGVPDYFGLFKGVTPSYFKWKAVSKGKEVPVDGYATTVFTDHAIDWISNQEKPWFLWLAYNAPHAPFHLPPKDLHSSDDLPDDAATIKKNPRPYYNAMLEALDTEIGRLLSSMDDDVRENTIFIFMGDNGSPNRVTRGVYGDHGAKGTIYDSGTHVPFIVSGKGIEKGRTEAFVNTTDMFSTVANIAGVAANSADSISFLPVLEGKAGKRDYIYIEHFSDKDVFRQEVFGWAVRQGNYKLISPDDREKRLYDLSVDPLEQVDLIEKGLTSETQKILDSLIETQKQVSMSKSAI